MKERFKYKTLENYKVTNLGLPYPVTIINSATERFDQLKKTSSVSIPDFDGFLAALGIVRAMVANKLLGSEIRFLRKVIGLRSKEFAEKMGIDPATVSRWENDVRPPSEDKERIMRVMVIAMLSDRAPNLAKQFTSMMVLQMALKARFEKGYVPKLEFQRSRAVHSLPETWQGKEAA